ncbi:hypothetical protein KI387_025425, partial [Taxus chinensis]
DPTGRKRSTPKREEKKPEKKNPSVVDAKALGSPEIGVRPTTYACKKKAVIKEKTPDPKDP